MYSSDVSAGVAMQLLILIIKLFSLGMYKFNFEILLVGYKADKNFARSVFHRTNENNLVIF